MLAYGLRTWILLELPLSIQTITMLRYMNVKLAFTAICQITHYVPFNKYVALGQTEYASPLHLPKVQTEATLKKNLLSEMPYF